MKKKLVDIVGTDGVLVNENLAKYSSFKIGGPAKFIVFPTNLEELKKVLLICDQEGVRYKIIGAGTNLLFADSGFDGVIISTRKFEKLFCLKDNFLKVSGGVMLGEVSAFCLENGFTGFEFAGLIPGTIGGATVMNAGAFGSSMSDIIFSVSYFYNGNLYTKKAEELKFGYRSSIFRELESAFILEVVFKLKKEQKLLIYNKVLDNNYKRKTSQPVGLSAGSVFKNLNGLSAGKIIDECGLKGCSIGGAYISEKHANFILNSGNATSKDVIDLINHVKNVIKQKKNIDLELELEIVK